MGCIFVFPCIRNKILNFHRHGVSTGILKLFSKLHICEKMQSNSYPIGKSMSNFGYLYFRSFFSSVSPTEIILNYHTLFSFLENMPSVSSATVTAKSSFLKKSFLVEGRCFHLTYEDSVFVIMFLNPTEKSLIQKSWF